MGEQFLDQDEEHRWERVLAALRADPGGPLAAQLATPWRLTVALAAFREAGVRPGSCPPRPLWQEWQHSSTRNRWTASC